MFAVAGAIAASGPVIIHLLNRRRYRVVHWAAMDFLREAMQRNRKILQIRDLLLLLLRTLAVLLFGLTLSRPFFSSSSADVDANQPLHAILIVDNSLSMGYHELPTETLLDAAKRRAGEYIALLPERSRISVIPLCGSASGENFDPYRTKEDAQAALDKLEVVDRRGSAGLALDLARKAATQAGDIKAKRIVFLSDQQADKWKGQSPDLLNDLPPNVDLQIVNLAPLRAENSWVSDLQVQDSIVSIDTPTKFVATIRHQGAARLNVQVMLSVDGVEVQARTIDLQPDSQVEVPFAPYRFERGVETGKTTFVPVNAALVNGDGLPADNQRYLVVPVTSGVPVVFVDQYGADEKPSEDRYGETYEIRHLLTTQTPSGETGLIQVRHVKIDQLDVNLLQDARLVVIAGVKQPGASIPLLRDYVRQGGQLLLAAGAEFDAAAWNQAAWLDGDGILPGPLQAPPGDLAEIQVQRLDYETMSGGYFDLADNSRAALSALYSEPLFFKSVGVNLDASTFATLLDTQRRELTRRQQELKAFETREKSRAELARQGKLDEASRQQREADQIQRAAVAPHWLQWVERTPDDSQTAIDEQLKNIKPIVLAAYGNRTPFMIEQAIGRGRVVTVTTGLFTLRWNNLSKTQAYAMFDPIVRGMLKSTLPPRNLATADQIVLPIDATDRGAHFTVTRPDSSIQELRPDSLDADTYALNINHALQRGIYRVNAARSDSANAQASDSKLWEIPLAVNGSEAASELTYLNQQRVASLLAPPAEPAKENFLWVQRGDAISLAGAKTSGLETWRWLAQLVLICLLVEMAVLAWPLRPLQLLTGIALAVAIIAVTGGTPVGLLENVVHYTVLVAGALAAVILIGLTLMRPRQLGTPS